MIKFAEVWGRVLSQLKPGMNIPNWTAQNGYFGNDITIVKVASEYIHFQSPTAKNIQIVPKRDFAIVWEIWQDYKSQSIKRHQVRDLTRFSRYIIDTFRWFESEKEN